MTSDVLYTMESRVTAIAEKTKMELNFTPSGVPYSELITMYEIKLRDTLFMFDSPLPIPLGTKVRITVART